MRFEMNGYEWFIRLVNPHSRFLIDRTGTLTIGTTDPSDRCIYISNNLDHEMFIKVLVHEMGHASIISYQLDTVIHKYVHKKYWFEAEEWLCNYIAIYGVEIYRILKELRIMD